MASPAGLSGASDRSWQWNMIKCRNIATILLAAAILKRAVLQPSPGHSEDDMQKIRTSSLDTSGPSLQNQDISECSPIRKKSFGIDLMDIHAPRNPYDNFVPQKYGVNGPDLVGWSLDRDAFDAVMNEIKPKFMVEVGSWKGSSAVYFANKMRQAHGPEQCLQLICVDTWLGTTVAWESQNMDQPEHGNTLYLRNGYPSVYYQFLYNVIDQKADDVIVPLPLPGMMGAIYLARSGAHPDLVYIDGCHDKECVLQDLQAWFPVIGTGGVLFGDDYGRDGVKSAVKEFCMAETKCQIDSKMTTERTWVIWKV